MEYLSALPGAISQGLVWGLLAIGVYITFKILNVSDLTVDGSICTGAAVCTMLIVAGVNPWVAVLAAFASGLLAGLVMGSLHVFLGIPAILSGILTQMALWSVNLKIMGKANQALPSRTYDVIVTQMQNTKALIILAAVTAVLIAVLYWFFGTGLGRNVRATGCNEVMSRTQGINTNAMKLLGLALSNGIVALSGAFLCQYQGFADINMGRGAIVIGLAAVVIGEAVVRRISQNFAVRLIGVSLGAVIYFLVYQTIIFFGVDTDLLKMLSALVVAVFLGVPYVQKKLRAKRKEGTSHA